MKKLLWAAGVLSAALQVAWGMDYLESQEERAEFEQSTLELFQAQARVLAALRVDGDLKTAHIEALREELRQTRLLAAFGSKATGFAKIGCDGSVYPEGSNGAAAHGALRDTGLCDPPEPLPDHRNDFIPPPAQLVAQ